MMMTKKIQFKCYFKNKYNKLHRINNKVELSDFTWSVSNSWYLLMEKLLKIKYVCFSIIVLWHREVLSIGILLNFRHEGINKRQIKSLPLILI